MIRYGAIYLHDAVSSENAIQKEHSPSSPRHGGTTECPAATCPRASFGEAETPYNTADRTVGL